MAKKKEVEKQTTPKDDVLIESMKQIETLHKAIVHINEDMGVMFDKIEDMSSKVKRLCERMGL